MTENLGVILVETTEYLKVSSCHRICVILINQELLTPKGEK